MIEHSIVRAGALVAACLFIAADDAGAQPRSEASPAAAPIPATVTPQTFAPELVETGRARFAADCGFCHGRDTAGGAGGSDLTRSQLVADDVAGDLIGEVVRVGRVDVGMPSFAAISDADLAAVVAYIHEQKTRAATLEGGRRSRLRTCGPATHAPGGATSRRIASSAIRPKATWPASVRGSKA
jgi:cytochrome c oxidase cbb3-type subunit 3